MPLSAVRMPVGKSREEVALLGATANRHGLIAGSAGTGKTVTLRVLAEQCSQLGVPAFLAGIKGDLPGISLPGGDDAKVAERIKRLGLGDFEFRGYPVVFWDVFGERGHPVRTTITEMGPLLLSRILNLNDVQGRVLSLAFKVADDQGLLLLDLKDLQAMARFVADNAAQFRAQCGSISTASVGAIQLRGWAARIGRPLCVRRPGMAVARSMECTGCSSTARKGRQGFESTRGWRAGRISSC